MKKAAELTAAELTAAARDYDSIHNEGGEGYNPYRVEIDRRDHDERKAAVSDLDKLRRRLRVECGSVARETYGDAAIDAIAAPILDAIDKIEATAQAATEAEWTREVTIARRERWNAAVKSGEFGVPGRDKIDYAAVDDFAAANGWNLDDLRAAIRRHEL